MAAGFSFKQHGEPITLTTATVDDLITKSPWFDVRAYGAAGDNTTNDTTAVQAAITAAQAVGGTVLFPKGTYKITTALAITGAMNIQGVPGALIRKTGAGHAVVYDGAATIEGISVRNISISTEAGGGDALRLVNVMRSHFDNVFVPSCAAVGVDLIGSLLNTFTNCVVSGNLAYAAGTRAVPTHGFVMAYDGATYNANANTFTGCSAEIITTSPGIGFYFNTADSNVIIGGTSEGNTIGIKSEATSVNNHYFGVHFETNGTNTVNMTKSNLMLTGGDTAASLTASAPAIFNMDSTLTDLVFTIDTDSPYPAAIQHRHRTTDGFAYPISINPLGGNINISADGLGAITTIGGVTKLTMAHFGTMVAIGNSGDAKTVDWTAGNKQGITATGAPCVLTFTAPAGACNLLLKITQGAGGAKTMTWPATVKWPGGTAVDLSDTASDIDIVSFYFDGTNYYGSSALDFS